MMSSAAGTTVEKIDRLYYCSECRMVFLFKSDATDHQDKEGHQNLKEMPFD
jgi:hypothetical protein